MSISECVPVLRVIVLFEFVTVLLQPAECLELFLLAFKHLGFFILLHLRDFRGVEEGLHDVERVLKLQNFHVNLLRKVIRQVLVL